MNTSSIAFPNLSDVSRNKLSVMEDRRSISNRVRLLILTEPTELYMNPTFGVGLKRYMFQYNNENTIALIRDRLIEQLKLWEPCVKAEATKVERGLKYTEGDAESIAVDPNHLKLTVTVESIYGDTFNIELAEHDFAGYLN